jgi:hypothetical protein
MGWASITRPRDLWSKPSASTWNVECLRIASKELAVTIVGMFFRRRFFVKAVACARHLSRYGWGKLIARVYETDRLQCGHCGGRIKNVAFVVRGSEIKKILAHAGLLMEAPEAHAAWGPQQSDLWDKANASEWGLDATYLDAADQDQTLHW